MVLKNVNVVITLQNIKLIHKNPLINVMQHSFPVVEFYYLFIHEKIRKRKIKNKAFLSPLVPTESGFTKYGGLATSVILPDLRSFCISLSTKEECSKAERLFLKYRLGGTDTKGILYPFFMISKTAGLASIFPKILYVVSDFP